jgi:hypothetical protein
MMKNRKDFFLRHSGFNIPNAGVTGMGYHTCLASVRYIYCNKIFDKKQLRQVV